MRKIAIRKKVIYFCLLAVMFLFSACGKQETSGDGVTYFHHSRAGEQTVDTGGETQLSADETEGKEYFLVTVVDQIEETLQLYRYSDQMEYRYYYSSSTVFYNKFGNRTPVTNLEPGLLVTIGEIDSSGSLTEVHISDAAWVYDDVKRFSVNPDMEMLKIGSGKYRFTNETMVFSGNKRLQMTDLKEGDVLSVVGHDKDVLSVRVTTAQGTLALTNTGLFEGSFLQLGTKIFTEITPDMEISVPEGTYELRVANKGWGGNTEVTITRGRTTYVDLDKIKGDGPSYGKIKFVIDDPSAELLIDGKETDYEKPVKLTYGSHSIVVYSTEYGTWKRNLFVNSAESTIVIELSDTEEEKSGNSEESSTSGNRSKSSSTYSENSSSSSESQSGKSEKEKREEDLETLRDLISGLTDSSSLVTK